LLLPLLAILLVAILLVAILLVAFPLVIIAPALPSARISCLR